jgi:hypothetical protein
MDEQAPLDPGPPRQSGAPRAVVATGRDWLLRRRRRRCGHHRRGETGRRAAERIRIVGVETGAYATRSGRVGRDHLASRRHGARLAALTRVSPTMESTRVTGSAAEAAPPTQAVSRAWTRPSTQPLPLRILSTRRRYSRTLSPLMRLSRVPLLVPTFRSDPVTGFASTRVSRSKACDLSVLRCG